MSMFSLMRRRHPMTNELLPLEQWLNGLFVDNGHFPAQVETRMPPRADIAETDKELLISLELPGMDENDINVKLSGNLLTVSGERKQKKEEKDRQYYCLETTYGAFERRFELPADVRKDAESVKATFHKGMLELRLPKAEPRPVAKIPVKSV
jgi:HSP20 family protein